MFNIGDKVLFSSHSNEKIKSNLGIIIDKNDRQYAIIKFASSGGCYIYKVYENYIYSVLDVEKVRIDIKDYYNPQIEILKSQIKTATSQEKIQERVDKYNNIKERIIKNCDRIQDCLDDEEFENRLKEINKLKKELHSMNLTCGDIIRKENGTIKYEIRKIQNDMNGHLYNLDDENIVKTFTIFQG